MDVQFQKSPGMIGRFAVVKLWPKIKAAEDENVARMKRTAASLGLECIEITPDGRALDPPHALQTQKELDFVIHLHFETPKAYDVFSFVALWNPVQFYHEWGYRRFSRHLLTHDDFLSCSARGTDDHLGRMIAADPLRLPPRFTMYHSLSEPIFEPSLGDRKIFYVGINWEKLGKGPGRHQELLNRLDPTGNLRIYGPRIFQGVNVWDGFQSYEGPIPFDGASIIKEINRCGISLVLSSDAHKESELMSNRLFESLAAGALIICDENPFAKRYFGDELLYIDARLPTDRVLADVMRHVKWVKENPDEALGMARRAQAIFRDRFSLDKTLIDLYTNLPQRKKQLESLYAPADARLPVHLLLLFPQFDKDALARHVESVRTQRHAGSRGLLLVDELDAAQKSREIEAAVAAANGRLCVRGVRFFERDNDGNIRGRRRLGQIISEAVSELPADALFAVVAPDEELFAEHTQSLAGALQRNPDAPFAHSNAIYRHVSDGNTYFDLQEEMDYLCCPTHRPLGFGRFLFRKSVYAEHIHSALRYVDSKTIALLTAAGTNLGEPAASGRASIICDIQSAFNTALDAEAPKELEVIRDYCPNLAQHVSPNGAAALQLDGLEPSSLSFKRLSPLNRQALAVELAHSIPIPSIFRRMIFGAYRFWLRRSK
jgi:hypothetical protein